MKAWDYMLERFGGHPTRGSHWHFLIGGHTRKTPGGHGFVFETHEGAAAIVDGDKEPNVHATLELAKRACTRRYFKQYMIRAKRFKRSGNLHAA